MSHALAQKGAAKTYSYFNDKPPRDILSFPLSALPGTPQKALSYLHETGSTPLLRTLQGNPIMGKRSVCVERNSFGILQKFLELAMRFTPLKVTP
jgi:hypothetical protein